MKNKVRLSYTLLEFWRLGKIQEALDMYFRRRPTPSTPAMEQGKQIHESVQKYVLKHLRFPEQISKIPVKNPVIEQEFVVDYSEQFLLKVKIDIFDTDCFFELKTGMTDVMKYTRDYQIPIYFLACELSGNPKKKAYIIHYNQYSKEKEVVLVWNSKRQIDLAKNYIDSIAPDIYQYFNGNGLW